VSESDWISVYQSQTEYLAHIKKLVLEDAGIDVKFSDGRDSSYNAFGYVHLLVPKSDEEEAQRLLKDHE
tara:strand:+ start:78 stop:284 length:207 start_codon:yes stop_codon:yes gene_type:complete